VNILLIPTTTLSPPSASVVPGSVSAPSGGQIAASVEAANFEGFLPKRRPRRDRRKLASFYLVAERCFHVAWYTVWLPIACVISAVVVVFRVSSFASMVSEDSPWPLIVRFVANDWSQNEP